MAKVTSHNVRPSASDNVPLTEHERLGARLITTPSGKTVLDFGQNIAGYAEFALNARSGQEIRLRFGEMLDENREFTQKNIQCSGKKVTTPLQQVIFTCADGMNRYKTSFAIFGFQYVLVETDVPFCTEDFTAVAVYSDMERTGFFESSNPLLDKFVENTVWSAKNNHADLPTDCPTRERHGWADARIIMPYTLWKHYGDIGILNLRYEGMKRYAGFMMRRCGKWGGPYAKPVRIPKKYKRYLVNRGQSYGEWAEPEDFYVMRWYDFAEPHPEVSTAYTAYMMELMARIAEATGHKEDLPEYIKYRDGCRETYQAMMRTEKFSLDTDRQAQLVRPLAMGLLDKEQTVYAEKRLIKALDNYGWRLGTGFLSTPLILDVLTRIDTEAAYRLLENEEIPGWLSMPKNGVTTIWESWEGDKAKGSGVASLDHYSKGAVCRWLFDTMCGIRPDGENRFKITPHPGGHFTMAKAAYVSVCGRVESGWEKTVNGFKYTVTVPANCTAELCLPDGRKALLEAGTHTF